LKTIPLEVRKNGSVDEHPELANLYALEPDFRRFIFTMLSGGPLESYKKTVTSWLACKPYYHSFVELLLEHFSTFPNQEDAELKKKWNAAFVKTNGIKDAVSEPSLTQVVSPSTTKGYNGALPTTVRPGGVKSVVPMEFIRFLGFTVSAIPRYVKEKNKAEDFKIYGIHPANLEYGRHKQIFDKFSKKLKSDRSPKLDILSVLNYQIAMLEIWRDAQDVSEVWRERPNNFAKSLYITYYAKMRSHIVSNISEIELPNWICVETVDDAQKAIDLLAYLERMARFVKGDNNEEITVLNDFREFLTSGSLRQFLKFNQSWNAYAVSQLVKNGTGFLIFDESKLEELFMAVENRLTPILESEGLNNIAKAIRAATIRPLFQKKNRGDSVFSIRYELPTDLKNASVKPDKFIEALTAFVQSYNFETLKVYDAYASKGKEPPMKRSFINSEDVAEVIALVDQYGPGLICGILLALGQSLPRKKAEEQLPEDAELEEEVETVEE